MNKTTEQETTTQTTETNPWLENTGEGMTGGELGLTYAIPLMTKISAAESLENPGDLRKIIDQCDDHDLRMTLEALLRFIPAVAAATGAVATVAYQRAMAQGQGPDVFLPYIAIAMQQVELIKRDREMYGR